MNSSETGLSLALTLSFLKLWLRSSLGIGYRPSSRILWLTSERRNNFYEIRSSVGATAGFGAALRLRAREIELQAGIIFSLVGMVMAPIGTMIGRRIAPAILLSTFAVICLISVSGVVANIVQGQQFPVSVTGLFVGGCVAGMLAGSALRSRLSGAALQKDIRCRDVARRRVHAGKKPLDLRASLIKALPPLILCRPAASSNLLKRTLAASDDVTKTHPSG